MTTKSHNQLCAVCGGELEATTITHEVKRGTHMPVPTCAGTSVRRAGRFGLMRKCCKSLTG